ncbi:MAG: TMEM14 family protein [Verrucomicrobia bacterium]|jgi:uncharacterized membrane protein (UPF0136 family)|nr:TMEM14 family protein [Verrucomicrobiota bacterium]
MRITPTTLLWIYIGLLLAGGIIGYLKAKSQVSLITSLVSAGLLALCALRLFVPGVEYALLGALILVFGIRFAKTKKFMPSGMLGAVTVLTLVLYAILAL